MKKTKIAVILTIAILISVLPAGAFASAGVTLTPNKTVYTPSEDISVAVAGVTAEMENAKAMVSIQKATERPELYGSPWKYVRDLYSTGYVWTFKAPDTVGDYEIRFYDKDGDYANSLIARAPVKVEYTSDQVIEIFKDKTKYTPNEQMNITVRGYTPAMETMKAFVSIAKKNERPENYGSPWKYVRDLYATSGVWTVNAPTDVGEYELRFYAKDGDYANSLVMNVPLEIVYSNTETSVTTDRSEVAPGGDFNVTVAGVNEAMKSVKAFVSIAKANDRPENYGSPWKYIRDLDITNGIWSLKAPTTQGNYEVRLYAADKDYANSLLLNAPFTVADNAVSGPGLTVTDSPDIGETAPIPEATPTPAVPTVSVPSAQPQSVVGNVSFAAEAVDSGVKFSWNAYGGALGYRIYRSKVEGEQGVSITDFYIGGTSFVDVNVDPNTTYYYTVYAVLSEATSSGGREQVTGLLGVTSISTGSSILGGGFTENGGKTKSLILMKLDDPYMNVDGELKLIDPPNPGEAPRNTSPMLISSRTMIPIRAVIESMGGYVGWDDATQKITLIALGHDVTMWLDKKDLFVDGGEKEMDVAPQAVNGRTMVPVRFAAENVGCAVDWINRTSEIVIVFYRSGTAAAAPAAPAVASVPEPVSVPEPAQPEYTGSQEESGYDSQQAAAVVQSPAVTVSAGGGPEIKITYTAAELARLRSDIEALIQDEPTGGRVITYAELESMIAPYYKQYGSGNTYFIKMMFGDFEKRSSKWNVKNMCRLMDSWSRDSTYAYMNAKSETLHIVNVYEPEKEGSVECMLNKEDDAYTYMYMWFKTATTGDMYKMPKTSSQSPDGDPYLPADLKVTLYPDAVVDGQNCIVYSYYMNDQDTYFWFSKDKGFGILVEHFTPGAQEVNATFTYDIRNVNCNDDFFDPSKQGVNTWNDKTAGY